ncbi:hypothetical protein GP486_002636 [Trichoglossum hirsutum]|uniref:Integral membrane protein n=1 Tax=Trichoglossum hirsutum TaxID=265104 RepID=A0A9P8LED8_9PEZI|nr:hypothetical protein GP486_002636 [Trichoglossum hirsutum]
MNMWLHALLLSALAITVVTASEIRLDEKDGNSQRCSGMYSRKTWGGSVDPFILTKFEKSTAGGDPDPTVSFVIFEWHDEKYVGRPSTRESGKKEYICDEDMVQAKYCNDTDIGKFILEENALSQSQSLIISEAVHLKDDPQPIKYEVKRTGYYCVGTHGYSTDTYSAVVVFRNAYGELPAAQIPKLPFYGGLTITYAVIGAFWAFLYVQHRQDILPVQNYITAIIVFLIVEMLMTWGFYDYQNRHGSNALAKVLMVIVSILNAGRNSFSFFLLLIVCMGYGVVKPSLGKTMLMVRGLAAAHFIFGVIYAVGSLTITPDSAGPLVLLVVLPLAGTLTAFYVWTLNSLNATMKDLLDRKQNVKAMMYKKLWWCILASILVIFGFFFINSFSFAGRNDPDFVPNNWKTRWFILDGWLNLVYLVDITFVAYLWRPTANNRRFAMSDEIAQDDEGFEIASFGGSLDDEEANTPPKDGDRTPKGPEENGKPGPIQPATRDHRESLDGEPIFAVGEDADKWSDDDESPRNSTERTRLTARGA